MCPYPARHGVVCHLGAQRWLLDIQPDYIDLTGGEIVMPPQQPMPILPVQSNLHRHLSLGLMAGIQQTLCSCCLPHLLWCLMLPLLLCCQIIVMVTPQSRCRKLFLMLHHLLTLHYLA